MSGWNHKPHWERGGLFLSPGKYPLVMADFDGHHDGIKDSQQVSETHFWECLSSWGVVARGKDCSRSTRLRAWVKEMSMGEDSQSMNTWLLPEQVCDYHCRHHSWAQTSLQPSTIDSQQQTKRDSLQSRTGATSLFSFVLKHLDSWIAKFLDIWPTDRYCGGPLSFSSRKPVY